MRTFYSSIAATILTFLICCPALAQYGPAQGIAAEQAVMITSGDLDNDLDNDLVVAGRYGVVIHYNQDGAGDLQFGTLVAPGHDVVHVCDLDGDSDLDLITSKTDAQGIIWFKNQGGGSFAQPQELNSFYAAVNFQHHDVDQDGDMDLLFITPNHAIALMENSDGLGNMAQPVDLHYANGPMTMNVIDLNNDELPDIMLSDQIQSTTYWLEGHSGHGFAQAQLIQSMAHASNGDTDSDGTPDMILAHGSQGILSWKRGPALAQAAANIIAAGVPPDVDHCTMDLDGDGDQDLLTTSKILDQVSWYENINGQGQFGPQQVISSPNTDPIAVHAMDVNGDGDKEVFVIPHGQDNILWYENLTNALNMIAGRVYLDVDQNGQFNVGDHGLVNIPVQVQPGVYAFSNASGMYSYAAGPGDYTVRLLNDGGHQFTTASHYHVTLSAQHNCVTGLDIGLAPLSQGPNVDVLLNASAPICDKPARYWLVVRNTGHQVYDIRVSVTMSDLTTFGASSTAPINVHGNELSWHFTAVPPTHQRSVELTMLIPEPAFAGQSIIDQTKVDLMNEGSVVFSAEHTLEQVVLCSFDPNDKNVSPPGNGEAHETHPNEVLHYTVRFQNTGTAPADNVWIIDTLDQALDRSTFQLRSTSHPVSLVLDDQGVLEFFYENIQLPDSASDPLGSQGYLTYSILPKADVGIGTVIENTAHIFFDGNDAVVTNTVFNTMSENGPAHVGDGIVQLPELLVFPNPTHGDATVDLGPLGTDPVELTLFDATGKQVRSSTTQGNQQVTLQRDGLSDGSYILRAQPFDGVEKPRKARVIFN